MEFTITAEKTCAHCGQYSTLIESCKDPDCAKNICMGCIPTKFGRADMQYYPCPSLKPAFKKTHSLETCAFPNCVECEMARNIRRLELRDLAKKVMYNEDMEREKARHQARMDGFGYMRRYGLY
jgi:hypothetical protein